MLRVISMASRGDCRVRKACEGVCGLLATSSFIRRTFQSTAKE